MKWGEGSGELRGHLNIYMPMKEYRALQYKAAKLSKKRNTKVAAAALVYERLEAWLKKLEKEYERDRNE